MGTLSFEPQIPPALWLTLLVISIALLFWYGWVRPAAVPRRRFVFILGWMALGLGLVLLILLNPTWIEPQSPPEGKPVLTVLVDATASMAMRDARAGETRYQAAAQIARVLTKDLGDRFEVRVRTFAENPVPADAEDLDALPPDGQVTDLAVAIGASLEENQTRGQAMVLLSDGIHNGGGGTQRVVETARLARAMASPVYTCTLGGNAEVKDLAVELQSPQELAYVGQKIPVTVLLKQHGLAGNLATIVLLNNGKEVERRQVTLRGEDLVEVRFAVSQEKAGLYRYEVRAEPLPGEVSLVNNTASLLLRVVNEPVRILLLEGKPYWDTKFLTRTLLSDPSLELDSLVRVSENRLHRRTQSRNGLPVPLDPGDKPTAVPPGPLADTGAGHTQGREEWKTLSSFSEFLAQTDGLRSYQILVLGRDAEVFLTEPILAQLRTWVSRDGGCLVCCRGQPMTQMNQRLGQMLPLRWTPSRETRFRVSLTERGRDLRWFPSSGADQNREALAELPSLATSAHPENPKPLAVVLATAVSQVQDPESPVVAYQPYGTGRVVVIEGSGMWRWAFLPPEQQLHDEVYRSLWHGLLRWLVSSADLLPGQKLALRSDKVNFSPMESATATLLLRDEALKEKIPSVELRGEGLAQPQTIIPAVMGDEPGAFRVAFGKLPEGRYQARVIGSAESDTAAGTAFDVRNYFDEQLDLKARPDLMARIAKESGGAVLEAETPSALRDQLTNHLDQSRPHQLRRLSAWDRWWVLVLVFAAWATGWSLRRSGGLV